jgi:hypothetical protein
MKHLKTPQELNEASENLNISDVITWLDINKSKPEIGQTIFYQGNLDKIKGEYIGFDNKKGVGKVKIENGEIDLFDKWTPTE